MLTVLTPPFPTRRPSDLALFAQALARLQPGGIVVASAANDAGAKSHEADLARIAGPLVSRSKHKCRVFWTQPGAGGGDATLATQWRSEEHTSELQSLMRISYAVFCLKKKKKQIDS